MPHPLERFGLLQPVTEQKDKGLSNESQIIIAEYWSGQLNTSNTEALYYNKYSVWHLMIFLTQFADTHNFSLSFYWGPLQYHICGANYAPNLKKVLFPAKVFREYSIPIVSESNPGLDSFQKWMYLIFNRCLSQFLYSLDRSQGVLEADWVLLHYSSPKVERWMVWISLAHCCIQGSHCWPLYRPRVWMSDAR